MVSFLLHPEAPSTYMQATGQLCRDAGHCPGERGLKSRDNVQTLKCKSLRGVWPQRMLILLGPPSLIIQLFVLSRSIH